MKQKMLFSLLAAFLGLMPITFAQKGNTIFGGNVIVGAPLGDLRNDYRSVFGIEGLAGFGVATV